MSSRGRSRARSGFRGMASSSGQPSQREQLESKEEETRSRMSELSIQGILSVFPYNFSNFF